MIGPFQRITPAAGGLLPLARRFAAARSGASAVEFAIIAPLFAFLFAGMIDLGGALYAKLRMNSALSAGANYLILSADKVNATDGQTLANTIAAIVAGSLSDDADVNVTINGGASVSLVAGQSTNSGSISVANQCFCPTISGSTVTWGTAVTCGSACTGGSLAGKYVTISASESYVPLFPQFGIVEDDQVFAQTIVQPQ